ncbi:WD40-repeat-containing domain protein [Dipodascopsis tothii]|uniref:WD40-repeat-containing domain protein n=1 Tax=Dipodascopsis tothii TaxID=44089 RepID=UPI0034CD6BA9
MKAHTLTVHWHTDNQPVYSAHFQPNSHRLATAGGDNNVRIWQLSNESVGNIHGSVKNPTCPTIKYLSTLIKHTQAVNVVRFDPRGDILASAGDDGNVILWTMSDTVLKEFGSTDTGVQDQESWRIKHLCRSSAAEVYDLDWSPDSEYIIAGSMDNIARIYSSTSGLCIRQVAEHNHYVQGVAWDPLNEYIATQSSDRSVHIYALKTRDGQFALSGHYKSIKADLPAQTKIAKELDTDESMDPPSSARSRRSSACSATGVPIRNSPTTSNQGTLVGSDLPTPLITGLPLPAVTQSGSPKFRSGHLYHNEGLSSFFRRLAFSGDGSLLFTPAGQLRYADDDDSTVSSTSSETPSMDASTHHHISNSQTNTVYIYIRAALNRPPIGCLPGLKKPAVAVRCSPVWYHLRSTHPEYETSDNITEQSPHVSEHRNPIFALPYRMIYAVATQDSVYVYDTQHSTPIAMISGLHYATFTDIAWSYDGNIIFLTSTDGFCSCIVFQEGELGEIYDENHDQKMDRLHREKNAPLKLTPAENLTAAHLKLNIEQETPTLITLPSVDVTAHLPALGANKARELDVGRKKRRIVPTPISQ